MAMVAAGNMRLGISCGVIVGGGKYEMGDFLCPELTEGLAGRRKKPVLASPMVWGGPRQEPLRRHVVHTSPL